jgi:CheY-like chemotaxis protein
MLMASDNQQFKGVKILVVDDEPDFREVVVACLKQKGAEVTEVQSAASALSCINHSKPDVIVTDIMMPNIDGFDLIRKVRSFSAEEGGQIPAIAITGAVSANIRLKYLTSGFQAYIIKPFDPEELVIVIGNLLER